MDGAPRPIVQAGGGFRAAPIACRLRAHAAVPPPLPLPLAVALGPFEVKLGLALGLCALLVVLEALATRALAALGLAGRGRARRWRSALALALPLVAVGPRLEGPEILAPTHALRSTPGVPDLGAGAWDLLNDAVFQFLPWESEVRRAWTEGHPPFWSDRLQSSPWSNPQAQALSPIAALARLFPLEHFLLAALAIKLLLAVDGAWALAAALGARWQFRALAAVSFALGGGMMGWAVFPHSSALALVPWLAAAALRLGRRAGAQRFVAAALATAALALGGHPEVAVAGGLLAALLALALRRRRAAALPALGRLAAAALLGLALAAPHVLPFYLETRESQRFAELAAAPAARAEGYWTYITGWFSGAHYAFLRSPLGPEVFGRPYFGEFRGPFNWVVAVNGYAGLAALAGAAIALTAAAARRRALPLVAFALFALAAAARFDPLIALVDRLPGARAMALERFLLPATLALAVAGALGAQTLARRPRRAGWLAFGAAAAASLAAAATPRTLAAWLLLGLAALAVRRRAAVAAVALAAALLLDLGLFARDLVPAGSARQLYPPSPLLAALARAERRRALPGRGARRRRLPRDARAQRFRGRPRPRPARRSALPRPDRRRLRFPPDDPRLLRGVRPPRAPLRRLSRPPLPARASRRARGRPAGRASPRRASRSGPPGRTRARCRASSGPHPSRSCRAPSSAGAPPSSCRAARRWSQRSRRPPGSSRAAGHGTATASSSSRTGTAGSRSTSRWPTGGWSPPRWSSRKGWRAEAGGEVLERAALFGAFLGFRAPAGARRVVLSYRPPGLATGTALAACALSRCSRSHGSDAAAPPGTAVSAASRSSRCSPGRRPRRPRAGCCRSARARAGRSSCCRWWRPAPRSSTARCWRRSISPGPRSRSRRCAPSGASTSSPRGCCTTSTPRWSPGARPCAGPSGRATGRCRTPSCSPAIRSRPRRCRRPGIRSTCSRSSCRCRSPTPSRRRRRCSPPRSRSSCCARRRVP